MGIIVEVASHSSWYSGTAHGTSPEPSSLKCIIACPTVNAKKVPPEDLALAMPDEDEGGHAGWGRISLELVIRHSPQDIPRVLILDDLINGHHFPLPAVQKSGAELVAP